MSFPRAIFRATWLAAGWDSPPPLHACCLLNFNSQPARAYPMVLSGCAPAAGAGAAARGRRATATGFAGRQSYAHTSDTSQILPRSWGLAVRELLLAARPKFTGIYVGNGLRFAEIRLSRLKKHTHTHTSDTHARLPTSESGCGRPAAPRGRARSISRRSHTPS